MTQVEELNGDEIRQLEHKPTNRFDCQRDGAPDSHHISIIVPQANSWVCKGRFRVLLFIGWQI